MNMNWRKWWGVGMGWGGRVNSTLDTTHKSDFILSLKWEDIRLWVWWGAAAAAEKPRWGLRASCSGYRLTEASDPATTSLSKVTQAKSEHKRLFLPALLEPASIKSSAGSVSLKMADFSKHRQPKTIKTLLKNPHKTVPVLKNVLYRVMRAW